MNNQFEIGEVIPELKPELSRFKLLLEEIPAIYFDAETTAAEIREKENNEEIIYIHESANLIINTFSKLDEMEQTADWEELKQQAEKLKNNLENLFPVLFDKK